MLSNLSEHYSAIWNAAKSDTHVLPLCGSSTSPFTLTLVYLLFVLKLGPIFMKDRKPFALRNVILAYNIIQMIWNLVMTFYSFLLLFYYRVYDYSCFHSLPPEHPQKGLELFLAYSYTINKFFDYLDTILFVLRKSFRQVTFLHVYHHILMGLVCHYYLHYYGSGGQAMSSMTFNSVVHTLMYGYYFLSASRPGMKASLWWKKYLTCFQLFQFCAIFLHNLYPLIFRPSCQFPKLLHLFLMSQNAYIGYLFAEFFIKAYVKKEKSAATKSN